MAKLELRHAVAGGDSPRADSSVPPTFHRNCRGIPQKRRASRIGFVAESDAERKCNKILQEFEHFPWQARTRCVFLGPSSGLLGEERGLSGLGALCGASAPTRSCSREALVQGRLFE